MALHAGKLIKPEALPTDHGVTLVQSDIPITDSNWSPEYFEQTLNSLAALSLRPSNQPPSTPGLIVWPESPAPFWATDLHLRHTLADIARSTDSYVIAGTLGIDHTGEINRRPDVYNSASVIAPDGAWISRYDKSHLVPFGEYVPFEKLFSFAGGLTRQIGTFSRGRLHAPLFVGDAQAGIFICYESIFPNEVRRFALHGADFFVNISNDGWYGEGGAPLQHLNMARMRAVENNRWLLRDTNTGVTAIIDPFGRVIAKAPRNQRIALQGTYALEESTTFYTRHGDWFPFLCAIITLVGLLLHFSKPAELTSLQPA
jgi:apolipoprotein N-acyltransferase